MKRAIGVLTVVFLLMFVSACAPATNDSDPDPFPAPAIGMQISSPEVLLEPGDERYVCRSFRISDNDLSLVDVEANITKSEVHHFAIFTSQEAYPGEDPYDCETMDSNWGFLTGGGFGDQGRDFPAGTAMHLLVGQHIVFQLHLANTGSSSVMVEPQKANLVGSAETDLEKIGVMMVGTLEIDIPAHSKDVVAMGGCTLKAPLEHVFGVYPHMHLLGRKIVTTLQPASGDPVVLNDIPWDFGEQQLYEVASSAETGDSLRVRCTYDNPSDQDVHFGLRTSDEMCFGIVYYYPADKLSTSCGIPEQAGP